MSRLVLSTRRPPLRSDAIVLPAPQPAVPAETVSRWLDDARLFAVGWAGGLVVFGTFLA